MVVRHSNPQAGFTLIELVMVIVILGILSAFALPRFADFGTEAREASLDGLAGALKSAASIAHAEQLVTGGATGSTVTLEGQAITMIDGYPTANSAGITAAANVDSSYTASLGGPGAGATISYELQTDCRVDYQAANGTTIFVVSTEISGC